MPEESERRPAFTHPLLYLWALLIVFGSIAGAAMAVALTWSEVRETPIQPIAGPVDTNGKNLMVFTDLPQPDRTIVCTVRATKTGEPQTIEAVDADFAIDHEGTEWTPVALGEGFDEPRIVECEPKDGRSDNATYGYSAVGLRAGALADWIAIGGTALGFTLAAVVAWRRSRRSVDEV